MSDRAAVALAAATAVGAFVGGGPAPLVAALLGLVAVAARRPWLLCLAAALGAACLADRALAGLDPVAAAPVATWATLVGDPEPLDNGGLAVLVAVDGRRVEAVAHGPPAWALEPRLAGERVLVEGSLRPPPLPLSSWRVQRRIVGRFDVAEVLDHAPGTRLARGANALRRTLEGGAADLSQRDRSLLTGVVLGDDREQSPELADDFRASGLTHLLAVSGSNVAFVLALARPLLAWLPGWPRAVATLGVLGGFAALVRFEPSVLRAGAMAAIACLAATAGRPADRLRVLALAVTVLLLIDPLLVRSIGFALSVAASLGIITVAPRLAEALPGPRPLADALAVTLGAQAGALPLLVPLFGSVPLATVPANLLAVPAAGFLMTWGITAGVVAGVAGGAVADAVHLPTRVATWWLATVADGSARLPLGELRAAHAVVLAAAAAVAAAAWRRSRLLTALAATTAALAVMLAAVSPPVLAAGRRQVADGVVVHRAGDVTVAVLGGDARPRQALEGLRRAGARCTSVVVVEGGARLAARRAASALGRRCPGALVVAPEGEALAGWSSVPPGTSFRVGAVEVAVDRHGGVRVASLRHGDPGDEAAARGPPVRHHAPSGRDGHPEPDA